MKFLFLLLILLLLRAAQTSGSGEHRARPCFHFILVHGGGHGAWCWYKVSSRLRQAGHKVDTPDLISGGISNVDPKSVSTLEQYSSPLIELLESLPASSQVVLVGHSLGGASLTYAMEMFPQMILAAVYVAALMLPAGPEAAKINNELLVTAFQSSKDSSIDEFLYALSPPEDVVLANTLFKPSPLFDPTVNFTSARYGRVPRYFIKTKQDKVILREQQDLLIRTTPPTGVLELNSDHSPFFSRPNGLVQQLLKVAEMEARRRNHR